jgi:hypothetical protein
VRTYLAQRARIDQMEVDQGVQRERIRELTERLERWDDPEYVAAQVRTRLRWVREGELTYLVVAETSPTGPAAIGQGAAWFSQLWGNVQDADSLSPDGFIGDRTPAAP